MNLSALALMVTLLLSAQTAKPAPTPPPPQIVSNSAIYQINQYRASFGLSGANENSSTCNFASLRASEISQNFSHEGFRGRIDSNTLPYTSYSEITENIAQAQSVTEAINLWINSQPHAENMRKDTPYVCIRNFGNYFVYEGLRP